MPCAATAGADDVARYNHRVVADGDEAGRGQRILCSAGACNFGRPECIGRLDSVPGTGGLRAGLWEPRSRMKRWAWLAVTCGAWAQAPQPMQLTLADAQRLAVQNNPQFGAARLNAAAAYQVPAEFRANLQPSVLGSITGVGADSGSRLASGSLNNPVVYNRLGTGLSVSQLITDFGRTHNLVDSAKLRAQAQDQVTESTRAQILLATSRAYFSVLRAQAVLKVAQETVTARQLVSDQVTALEANRLKSALDVSFANVNLADAKLLLAQAQNDLHSSEAELAAAMGLPGQTAFTLAEEAMPDALPDHVEPLIQDALTNRPELKDLRLEQSAAERFAKAERSLSYPTVAAVGAAGFVPAGEQAVPWRHCAIGLELSIPGLQCRLF